LDAGLDNATFASRFLNPKNVLMEKSIVAVLGGENVIVDDLLVNRLLPGPGYDAIGPVVRLEHTYPTELPGRIPGVTNRMHAHPHRGIVTCTYVLEGELTHIDSKGNHGKITAGGMQWLKAGNGIMHEESPDTIKAEKGLYHCLQFWINLPAMNKLDAPEYIAIQPGEIPALLLPGHAGSIRILVGSFGSTISPVRTFSRQFIYHIRLNPKSAFTFSAKDDLHYAAFIPSFEVLINGCAVGKSKIIIFDSQGNDIHMKNEEIFKVDVLILGGESYAEQMVSQGPFVMNSYLELAKAYRDFFAGKYGTITHT
jgi:redox-sensitive bicupin YhaK (pirin superfamily)